MVEPQHTSSPDFWTTFTNFLRTQKAILLIAETIYCIVVLCCFKTVEYYYLSAAELALSIFFFIIYAGSMQSSILWISWPWCDFFRTAAAAILYLISSIPALAVKGNRAATIEGMLGLMGVCLFGYDAGLSFPSRQ